MNCSLDGNKITGKWYAKITRLGFIYIDFQHYRDAHKKMFA